MSRRPIILVTGADLAPQALALLSDFDVVYAGKAPQEADLIALCRQHDPVAIIVRYGRITAPIIAASASLRVISKHGSGTDTIDRAAAEGRGIQVLAAAGANAAAVAEQAVALMLACAKSVVHLNERMHAGHWDKATHKSVELSGRTVGVVGLGAIGQRFARIAAAMDMTVIGFDPYASNPPAFIEPVTLDAIWARSDVISLHCPLTEDNQGMVNETTLGRCKTGVIIVNTGRGGLIDERSLLTAIANGKVVMAGLDAFAQEPPSPDHPFFGNSRLVLSPHIGGVTSDAYVNMGVASARNILKALGVTAST
ncbi:NAD(P)-dependent oxidoreductase [Hylemonella gracilis]|uniref:D-isomer specific 2-hydroxyacid dehydrogenase NAD-binding protein n=1 Tax=Hylemonella gracilis ATCC 19624 TaxID=887062 RepID=F3KSK4_9BURK|nr:NAD(P)-dependent oxidoreductase [Hylemonella gracilis]EGI77281.1 D-isomer specific 2-hydroxyacid dehydrogenase NAD-binding protein [Hylemonella gracilis ATCC 19624]